MKLEASAILNKMLLAENPRPGALTAETSAFADPAGALAPFLSFGGEGWLCLAAVQDVLILPRDAGAIPAKAWPVAGELANGKTSLRLNRENNQWIVTRISESSDPDGLLVSRSFLRRGTKGTLAYDVHFRARDLEGLSEFRPDNYRFTGFQGR